MKILLVEPLNKNFIQLNHKVYVSKLTMPYISSYLINDFEIEIVDENINKIDFNTDADCIFITALTVSSLRAYEIGDEFRKRGKKVVMGGIHVTMLPNEAILHADTVVIGECENVMTELINDIKNKTMKPFYKSDKTFSLAGYKNVNNKLIDKKKYRFISLMETGRGCPYNCDFCSTTKFFGSKQRFRPVEDVVENIKQSGEKWFFFTDDNIICNKKRAKELFEALIPLNIQWTGQGSVNIAKDNDMLALMKKSGCRQLLVGFESLDPENIDTFTGKHNVNNVFEYEEYIKTFHKHGIGLLGCFVFGFDHDNVSIFKRTYNFIMRNNIDAVQFTILTPFPGTKLYDTLDKENRIIHKDWSKYDVVHVTYKPKLMTPDQLRKGYNQICKKIYSLPNILKRSIKSYRYLKKFNHSFITIPVINYVYRKLFSIGKAEKIWKYLYNDLFELFFQKISELKKSIFQDKNNETAKYFIERSSMLKKISRIYKKLINKVSRVEKNIFKENFEKIIKKTEKILNYLDKKIERFKNLKIPKSILNFIEDKKIKIFEIFNIVTELRK